MLSEISCCAYLLDVEPLHFILRKPLLHAITYKRLTVVRQPIKNFNEGQGLLIGLISLTGEVLYGVNETARCLDIGDLLQVLFVYHFKVTCGC